ncbi:MAG: ABC transporter permease [Acidimicrobiales bacterium]
MAAPAVGDLADDLVDLHVRVVTPRRGVVRRLADVYAARELLVALVRKELKVKYKDSTLGFVWSMLNPALYLAVFYVVFSLFLQNGIPLFPLWLLSGLLVWNFFSMVLPTATGTLIANSALVKKVSFPREVLPLAAVGAGMVHFCLQGLVLLGALAVFRHPVAPAYLWLLPIALMYLVLFSSALAIALSAMNVYVRDLQHLLELVLLGWFWMTPIVYPYRQVSDKLGPHGMPAWAFLANPITPVVVVFQRALYGTTSVNKGSLPLLPEWGSFSMLLPLLVGIVGSLALLAGAIHLFGRLEANFAEEM